AETVLVLPASGAGVSSEIIQSARALFVNRLANADSRLTILDRDRPPTPDPPDRSTTMVLGMQARADAAILVDLRRAGGATMLTVTGLGVPAGDRLFLFQQSTAAGPEVIPSLIDAAVASAVTKQGSDRVSTAPPPQPRS